MNNEVRLSDRKRLLILKSIRYAMDSASLWTFEPGPPVFELYLIGRALMGEQKGRPLRWQGYLDENVPYLPVPQLPQVLQEVRHYCAPQR